MLRLLLKRWPEKLFFLLVVASVSGVFVVLVEQMVKEQSVPLTELVVQGDRSYVADNELQHALKDIPNGGNFFTLDVTKVQNKVESLPWVRRASIRKQWPNRLVVYLHEQQPVAWWNERSFINTQGELFEAPMKLKQPLAHLSGPKQSEGKVLATYLQLKQLLEFTGFNIATLALSPRHDWNVQLSDGLKLIVGQSDMLDRMQRFIDLYPVLEDKDKIDYLDLRYDTGIAVGFKS